MRSHFYPCGCHTHTCQHCTPSSPQHQLTLMPYLISIHVHHVRLLILYLMSTSFSRSSWSSKLVTCPICQWGSTAPSRTTSRRRDESRVDTSSACLLPSRTSSQSQGTKVGTGRVMADIIGVVRSQGGSHEQSGQDVGSFHDTHEE